MNRNKGVQLLGLRVYVRQNKADLSGERQQCRKGLENNF